MAFDVLSSVEKLEGWLVLGEDVLQVGEFSFEVFALELLVHDAGVELLEGGDGESALFARGQVLFGDAKGIRQLVEES